jgi:UDP-glucose 4-epimerase
MRILVTGASGYIGSHLVERLAGMDHDILGLDIRPAADLQAHTGYEIIVGSLADQSRVTQALQDVDVVYHLAWSFHEDDFHVEAKNNLLGTLNLLQACQVAKVKQFIFGGTAVVYGPTGSRRVDEEDACHPEKSTIGGAAYGITKLACEKYTLAYRRLGIEPTILRMHGVFSQERLGQFGTMIDCARRGEEVVAVKGAGGEYVHLEDVLEILDLVLGNHNAYGEIFNVAGLQCYEEVELARRIIEMTGSMSELEIIEDAGQGRISVNAGKLRRNLGFHHKEVDFLTGLLRAAIFA